MFPHEKNDFSYVNGVSQNPLGLVTSISHVAHNVPLGSPMSTNTFWLFGIYKKLLSSCKLLILAGIEGLLDKSLYEPLVATVAKSAEFALPDTDDCVAKVCCIFPYKYDKPVSSNIFFINLQLLCQFQHLL